MSVRTVEDASRNGSHWFAGSRDVCQDGGETRRERTGGMLDDAVERMVPDGSGGAVSAHTGGPMGSLPFVVARRGVT
jgi:hypothetical protein